MSDERPANLIIVLDTDSLSGKFQATGGPTCVETCLTLWDIVGTYVGDAILNEMTTASAVARSYNTMHEISPRVLPWASITPEVHRGWHIMVMISSGSSVRQPIHWDYISQLFSKYVLQLSESIVKADKICSNLLDLLIGFDGHEAMPHGVQPLSGVSLKRLLSTA